MLKNLKNVKSLKNGFAATAAIAIALTLSGCGGGGGGDTAAVTPPPPPPPPANIDLAQLQGRWATATGAAKGYTALVLQPQSGSVTAWVLAQDASTVSKLAITGTTALSVTGKTYTLAANPQTLADVTGAVTATLTSTPKTLALASLGGAAVSLSQTDALATTAALGDVAATWKASVGAGSVQESWVIAADGKFTGTSTSGCTWVGTLTTTTGLSLYNLAATEDCQGTVTSVSGIASLSTDKARLTAVGTTTDATSALVLFFAK